jgi:hypothetical protein
MINPMMTTHVLFVFKHQSWSFTYPVDEYEANRGFNAACQDSDVMAAILYGPQGFINSYQHQESPNA